MLNLDLADLVRTYVSAGLSIELLRDGGESDRAWRLDSLVWVIGRDIDHGAAGRQALESLLDQASPAVRTRALTQLRLSRDQDRSSYDSAFSFR